MSEIRIRQADEEKEKELFKVYTFNDLQEIKEELIKSRYEIKNNISCIEVKEPVSPERLERVLPERIAKDYSLMISIIDAVQSRPIFLP